MVSDREGGDKKKPRPLRGAVEVAGGARVDQDAVAAAWSSATLSQFTTSQKALM
jgi:hypothetical protein